MTMFAKIPRLLLGAAILMVGIIGFGFVAYSIHWTQDYHWMWIALPSVAIMIGVILAVPDGTVTGKHIFQGIGVILVLVLANAALAQITKRFPHGDRQFSRNIDWTDARVAYALQRFGKDVIIGCVAYREHAEHIITERIGKEAESYLNELADQPTEVQLLSLKLHRLNKKGAADLQEVNNFCSEYFPDGVAMKGDGDLGGASLSIAGLIHYFKHGARWMDDEWPVTLGGLAAFVLFFTLVASNVFEKHKFLRSLAIGIGLFIAFPMIVKVLDLEGREFVGFHNPIKHTRPFTDDPGNYADPDGYIQPASVVTHSAPLVPVEVIPERKVREVYIDAKQFSFDHQEVRTGFTLVGEYSVEVVEFDLHNKGEETCKATGCDEPSDPSKYKAPFKGFKTMALMINGIAVDSDKLNLKESDTGNRKAQVTVNNLLDPSKWDSMEGGVRLRFIPR